jgi:hypothetical protein
LHPALYERVNERAIAPIDFRPAPQALPRSAFTTRPSVRQTAYTLNTYDPESRRHVPVAQRVAILLGAATPNGRLLPFMPATQTERSGRPAAFAAQVPDLPELQSGRALPELPDELPYLGGWQ